MPGGPQSPSEMEGIAYLGRDGNIKGVWETTALSLILFLLLTLEGVAGSGTGACWCPELFVEEGTVSVGGDHKFSLGVQDLKGTGNKGSEKWHRLACIVQFFVFPSSFSRFVFVSFLSSPILKFPSGKWGEGGKSVSHQEGSGTLGELWEFVMVLNEQS